MSRRTARVAALAATLATVGAMSVTAVPASAAESVKVEMNNWGVAGQIVPKKLGQSIILPANAGKFNGVLTDIPVFQEGTINGTFSVPNSSQTFIQFHGVPLEIGFTSGSLTGTFVHSSEYTVSAKANMVIVVSEKPGATCETQEPVTFSLGGVNTTEEFSTVGLHFIGTATIPAIGCTGKSPGFAKEAARVLTADFSGPNNAVSLFLNHP
jgi:hypothetical protein